MAHITLDFVGLQKQRSCIVYFNSYEVGRIQGKDTVHDLEIDISILKGRELIHNRPWYKEHLHVDFYDMQVTSKKGVMSALRTLSKATKSQDPIKSDGTKIGEVRLPLSHAVLNSSSLDEDEYEEERSNWTAVPSPMPISTSPKSSPRTPPPQSLSRSRSLSSSGADSPQVQAATKYDGVGRWYKLVPGSSNGVGGKNKTNKNPHKNAEEADSFFHQSETEHALINMLYHSEPASAETPGVGEVDAAASASPRSSTLGEEEVSLLWKQLSHSVSANAEMQLCELLPPSSPYFKHLYVDLYDGSGKADADAVDPSCVPPKLVLPGPTCGEVVLERHDGVEWRVSAGVNLFGDPIYIICKGMLVVTDLRVLFVPFYLNSSFWANGAVVGSPTLGGGRFNALGGNSSGKDAAPDPEHLASLCKYTYQLYLSALYDCRCYPTPLDGYSGIVGVSRGNVNKSSFSESQRASNISVGSGGWDTGEDYSARNVGAFMERCHEEYSNFLETGNIEGQSNTFVDTTDHVSDVERLKNSYNLIFEGNDGVVVEFTVPKVQKEIRHVKRQALKKIHKFLEQKVSNQLNAVDFPSESDEDDEDDYEEEDYALVSTKAESDADADQSSYIDNSEYSVHSKLDHDHDDFRYRTKSEDEHARIEGMWHRREYESGCATLRVDPKIFCARLCDTCIWQARIDRGWILWTKYMQLSVAQHLRHGELEAVSENNPDWISNELAWLQRIRQPTNIDSDYQRMRVLENGWRMFDGNSGYIMTSTYPQTIYVPDDLTDDDVYSCSKQRSMNRLQALVWIHPISKAPLVRCAQPLAGMQYSKLDADIRMNLAIKNVSISSLLASPTYARRTSLGQLGPSGGTMNVGKQLRIADARPKLNANANALGGKGFEAPAHIASPGGPAEASLHFLDIDNIHVMRTSLNRLKQGLVHTSWGWTDGLGQSIKYAGGSETTSAPSSAVTSIASGIARTTGLFQSSTADEYDEEGVKGSDDIVLVNEPKKMDTEVMSGSNWKVHLSLLLKGAVGMCESLTLGHPIVVHCSDGWDRTSQLSSLTALLLDPYYRTIDGFLMLVQKDWCAFGHKFEDRCMTGVNPYSPTNSCDKYVDILAPTADRGSAGDIGKQQDPSAPRQGSKSREISPVFLQFLDCVYQVHRQFPSYFEFNTHFLVVMSHAMQAGLFSSFRENCEKTRHALMRSVNKAESLRHQDLHFSTISFYIQILLRSQVQAGCSIKNALYNPPRARDRRFQYLRPRCSGPHDFEMWREGLCGFVDPYVGVLSDPTSYVYAQEERVSRYYWKTESVGNFARDIVEEVVEDVLDRMTRAFYHEVKIDVIRRSSTDA